ncbi:MAG: hypothetical protein ACM34B_03700, partial [Nitrospira sp.]
MKCSDRVAANLQDISLEDKTLSHERHFGERSVLKYTVQTAGAICEWVLRSSAMLIVLFVTHIAAGMTTGRRSKVYG